MSDVPPSFSEEYVSKINSSTANIGSGASFTGTGEDCVDFETLGISFICDQPTTIQIRQSSDNTNWDISDTYTVAASTGDARTFELLTSFYQVIITNNGGSATTFFRLQSILSPGADAVPRSLTQLGNFKVAIMEGLPTTQGVSGTVNIGNQISGIVGVSGVVNTFVTNFPNTQGVSGSVSVLNFPVVQGVSGILQIGAVSGVVGVSGIVNVNVQNFPSTQGVSGSVIVSGIVGVSGVTAVSGTVNIGNFPAVQAVSGNVTNFQGTTPWITKDLADGVSGQPVPGFAIQIAGADVSGILRTIHTDVSGNVFVSVLNFPTAQNVSGSVSVLNFPTVQEVSGTVNIGNQISGIVGVSGIVNTFVTNFPTTQGVSGSVSILNFPATQGVSGIIQIGAVSGIVGVSGIVNTFVTNFPATQGVSGSVSILNFPNPIGVSGTVNIGNQISGIVGVSGIVSTFVTNFPTTQGVSGIIQIGAVSGVVGVSGTVNTFVTNFPTTQGVSGSVVVSGIVGVSGITAISGTVNIGNAVSGVVGVSGTVSVSVTNFPVTQGVSGTVFVSVLNFPTTQGVSGSVSVLNFPTTQGVSGSVVVSGIVGVSGTVNVSVTNFPTTQGVSGTVTVNQGAPGVSGWPVIIQDVSGRGFTSSPTMGTLRGLDTVTVDGPQMDSLNHLRVTGQGIIFSYGFANNVNTLLFNSSVSGSGTFSFVSGQSAGRLFTTTSASDSVVAQTKRYVRHNPGVSHEIYISGIIGAKKTNVRQRWGYFDDKDGLFFEQTATDIAVVVRTSATGSPVDTRVIQTNWNLDKLDGTGSSGFNLDTTKHNAYVIDFVWQGAGRVRFGIMSGKGIIYFHQVLNANVNTTPFMRSPSRPGRMELTNLGTVASSTNMDIVCVVALREVNDVFYPPFVSTASRGTTSVTVSGIKPLVTLRPKAIYNSLVNRVPISPKSTFVQTNQQAIYVQVYLNATLTGAAFTSAGTNSAAEYDTTATAISGGTLISEFYVTAGTGLKFDFNQLSDNAILGLDILGTTQDTITIAATSLAGNSGTWASIAWEEYQ